MLHKVSAHVLPLHCEIEHLVTPPLKIRALGAVAAQRERSLVGIGGSLALVRPTQQIGARRVTGIIAVGLTVAAQQLLIIQATDSDMASTQLPADMWLLPFVKVAAARIMLAL